MNVELIKIWIANNEPRGIEKLSIKADVSVSGIRKIIQNRTAGLKTAIRIAKAIGVSLPALCADKDQPAA